MSARRFIGSSEPPEELVDEWRRRADELDDRARELRLDGDQPGAVECELAAIDYRDDADRLEFALDRVSRLEP